MSTTPLPISEADVAAWITARVRREHGERGADMGKLEQAVEQVTRAARRQALEALVQQQADAQPLNCPACKQRMNVEAYGRERRINSSFGWMTFRRDYGFCVPCGQHAYPADVALGLHSRATHWSSFARLIYRVGRTASIWFGGCKTVAGCWCLILLMLKTQRPTVCWSCLGWDRNLRIWNRKSIL